MLYNIKQIDNYRLQLNNENKWLLQKSKGAIPPPPSKLKRKEVLKMTKTEKTLVGVRLDNELVEDIDKTAKVLGLSRSGVITLLLKRHYVSRSDDKILDNLLNDVLLNDVLLKELKANGTR